MGIIGEDMTAYGVNTNMVKDKEGQRERIRVADLTCVNKSENKEDDLIYVLFES